MKAIVHTNKVRTALRHVGGAIESQGDSQWVSELSHAVKVRPEDEDSARAHVHGFHSYPARMHPVTAARLVKSLRAHAPGLDVLLDPFCGSGTVLVEGRLCGLSVRGTDINPLAVRLAERKVRSSSVKEREALLNGAKQMARMVLERHASKAKVSKRYAHEDVAAFEPHILMELDDLRVALNSLPKDTLQSDLELVFSAILTKVSRRKGDSAQLHEKRRLPPGFATRMFVAKTEELVQQLAAFQKLLPTDCPAPDVHLDDAHVLGTIGAASVDAIVTSPPYVGTYDYLHHHDVRLRWLNLRSNKFAALEMGARRTYSAQDPKLAMANWLKELTQALSSFSRVLKAHGHAVIVIADSAIGQRAFRADEILKELAPKLSLTWVAQVSQARPHFHGPSGASFRSVPRKEHVIVLKRTDSPHPKPA